MNLKVSGVGAEPKKLAALGGLLLLALIVYFMNRSSGDSGSSSGPSSSPTASRVAPPAWPPPAQTLPGRSVSRRGLQRNGGGNNVLEFHPSLKLKPDAQIDRASIDPTLRLDLLEKLQKVKIEGGTRSLFEYTSAPPAQLANNIPEPDKIKLRPFVGPRPPAPKVAEAKPPEPAAPPIPLKFYGMRTPLKQGVKQAFFLDGEDIVIAAEGQLIKNRYKIVRIGVNSAVVEDTQFKNHQQTLPLVEEATG